MNSPVLNPSPKHSAIAFLLLQKLGWLILSLITKYSYSIRNSIPSQSLSSPPNLEVVSVKLLLKFPLTTCLIHTPPKSSSTYYINLCNYLNDLLSLNNKTILLGDFNLPDINWDSLSGQSPHSSTCDLVFKFNPSQFVTTPTYV